MDPVVNLRKEVFSCCATCSKAFVSEEQLLKHVYKHVFHAKVMLERREIYSCNQCRLAFLNPKDREFHKIVHKNDHTVDNSNKIYRNKNKKRYQRLAVTI